MSTQRRSQLCLVWGRLVAAVLSVSSIASCSRSDESPSPGGSSGAGESHDTDRKRTAFVDVTEASGIRFRHETGARGERHLAETTVGGLGWLDYDGDGRLDLYVTSGNEHSASGGVGTASNRLFRNLGDGRFEDVTEKAGVGDRRYSSGLAAADYDDDGDVDLYVANFGRNTLYRNEGDGTFRDVTDASGAGDDSWSVAAAFVDVDADGRLDLWVANYVDYDPAQRCHTRGTPTYCDPGEFRGAADRLYLNRGGGRFEEVGAERGIAVAGADAGKSLGVIALDYDDDGDQDVYVACDEVPNLLFRNDGQGYFEEVGLLADVAFSREGESQAGMGVDVGDLDLDGLPDLVVTNFSEERNAYYRNEGDGFFRDRSVETGFGAPSLPLLGFGIVLIDVDLDGDLDAYVGNGHVLDNAAELRSGQAHAQRDLLLENDGRGRFRDISPYSGKFFEQAFVSRGVASADFDEDGDEDLAVLVSGGAVRLLRNEAVSRERQEERSHWIALRLRGEDSPRDAIGAKVRVTYRSGERIERRSFEVRRARSYASSCDPRVRVGLGPGEVRDLVVEVRWPSGRESRHEGLAVDSSHEINETGERRSGRFFVGAGARAASVASPTKSAAGSHGAGEARAAVEIDSAKLVQRISGLVRRHRALEALAILEQEVPRPDFEKEWSADDIALRLQHAELLRIASRPEEATRLLAAMSEKAPANSALVRCWAHSLVDAGEARRAVELLEKLDRRELRGTLAVYGRALVLAGENERAVSVFAARLIADPWADDAYLELGRVLARVQRAELAEVFLERYRRGEPWRKAEHAACVYESGGEDAKASQRRARAELERGRLFEAMKLAQSALREQPGLVAVYLDLARISTFLVQPDDAKAAIESLRKNAGDHVDLSEALGRIDEALGDVPRAMEAYRSVLAQDATRVEIAGRLARLEAGEPPQALEEPEPEPLRRLRAEIRDRVASRPISGTVGELVRLVPEQLRQGRRADARALSLFLFRTSPRAAGVAQGLLSSYADDSDVFLRLWALRTLGQSFDSKAVDVELDGIGLDGKAIAKLLIVE